MELSVCSLGVCSSPNRDSGEAMFFVQFSFNSLLFKYYLNGRKFAAFRKFFFLNPNWFKKAACALPIRLTYVVHSFLDKLSKNGKK